MLGGYEQIHDERVITVQNDAQRDASRQKRRQDRIFYHTVFYLLGWVATMGLYSYGAVVPLNQATYTHEYTMDSRIWGRTLCRGNNCTTLGWTWSWHNERMCILGEGVYPLIIGLTILVYIGLLRHRGSRSGSRAWRFMLALYYFLFLIMMWIYHSDCTPTSDNILPGVKLIDDHMTPIYYGLVGYSAFMLVSFLGFRR